MEKRRRSSRIASNSEESKVNTSMANTVKISKNTNQSKAAKRSVPKSNASKKKNDVALKNKKSKKNDTIIENIKEDASREETHLADDLLPIQPKSSAYQQQNVNPNTWVRLACVKQGSKLRVRITSHGYPTYANCQFPRDIRQEGREFLVPQQAITLIPTRGKFFYRIEPHSIHIIGQEGDKTIGSLTSSTKVDVSKLQVYGTQDDGDCVVCMCEPKSVVFAPCGHFSCCQECAMTIGSTGKRICPMCRQSIQHVVRRDQIG